MNGIEWNANPADRATTPGERRARQEQSETALVEQMTSATAMAAESARRAADAAARVRVDRIRSTYYTEHPTATESDFERDLPALMIDSRAVASGGG